MSNSLIVELLRTFGHDVLTVQEAGNGGLGIPDEDVLAFAISHNRAVLTRNWILDTCTVCNLTTMVSLFAKKI